MVDGVEDKPTGQVRGRPFPKGRSGNPGGRRFGSRNKTTMAALELLADEAEALTRKAVEAALAGDPTAMRLCLERILPRDRAVKFALPPIKSAADVARAMGAVTAALAHGLITPAEGQPSPRWSRPLCSPLRPATSTGACRCSKPIRPSSRRASPRSGPIRALQPEEELPLQNPLQEQRDRHI